MYSTPNEFINPLNSQTFSFIIAVSLLQKNSTPPALIDEIMKGFPVIRRTKYYRQVGQDSYWNKFYHY